MQRLLLLVCVLVVLSSHDMFLKMDTYFLEANKPYTIQLYNGTFESSDNIITRDRMIDVSLVGNGQRSKVDTTSWTDQDKTTVLNFTSGKEGTWVAGVSTYARNIELEATAFNDYLKHDGVLDMLESRKQNNTLDKDAIEKYSKHVKLVFQVGDNKTNDWSTVLGYPIEFVSVTNPYDAKVGDDLQVKLLSKGKPLANQLVYVGNGNHEHDHGDSKHDHDSGDEHHHHDATKLMTDADGIVTMNLDHGGHWYLRTILMELSEEEGLTHESNWATLTFEVKDDHSHAEHGHVHADGSYHDHDHGALGGLSKYIYVLGGIVFILVLLFLLRGKK